MCRVREPGLSQGNGRRCGSDSRTGGLCMSVCPCSRGVRLEAGCWVCRDRLLSAGLGCARVCMCAPVCVCLCVSVCLCVHVCAHTCSHVNQGLGKGIPRHSEDVGVRGRVQTPVVTGASLLPGRLQPLVPLVLQVTWDPEPHTDPPAEGGAEPGPDTEGLAPQVREKGSSPTFVWDPTPRQAVGTFGRGSSVWKDDRRG